MNVATSPDFVNRDVELSFLSKCLSAAVDNPALVVLKAPPGYGKSSLTDRFRELKENPARRFCVVDPLVLDTSTTTRLHDGYFIQRCAETLDAAARSGRGAWVTFDTYLRANRWRTATSSVGEDLLEAFLADETVRRPVFNYLARFFGLGRYAPEELFSSDMGLAVARCTQYAASVLADHRLVLVIREAHLMDLYSLRTLLEASAANRRPDLIFEYTTEHAITSAHEKLFLRYGSAQLWPLSKMSQSHLQHLLQLRSHDYALADDAYVSWDGNLRAVQWLPSAGRGEARLPQTLAPRLATSLAGYLAGLPISRKLILAAVYAHGEPIPTELLLDVAAGLSRYAVSESAADALYQMLAAGGLIIDSPSGVRLDNETVAQAISEADAMKPFVAMAEKALRDLYWTFVDRLDVGDSGLTRSLRQIFRLSARTRDATGLLRACAMLEERVAGASDQAIYVEAVASALLDDVDLYRGDQDDLIIWAASLAYETSDPRRAAELLGRLRVQDSFTLATRAFALQEIGGHDTALELARMIGSGARFVDETLVSQLIEAVVIGCKGETDIARERLNALVSEPAFEASPFLGYAYRFYEVVDDFTECLPKLMLSISWFERFGAVKARAYSQLPAAMLLARLGRTEEARAMFADAASALHRSIRDQHLLLNNNAAIELLADEPDYRSCVSLLEEALRFARDDFSELIILTNLSLARLGVGDVDAAAGSARQTLSLLQGHDFADKDIYWPICFNAAQVFSAKGDLSERDAALEFPKRNGRPLSANAGYWRFRYGETEAPPPTFEFLASRPRHPIYLSHWLMEVELLQTLRRGPRQ